jgi:hypothetical protein
MLVTPVWVAYNRVLLVLRWIISNLSRQRETMIGGKLDG